MPGIFQEIKNKLEKWQDKMLEKKQMKFLIEGGLPPDDARRNVESMRAERAAEREKLEQDGYISLSPGRLAAAILKGNSRMTGVDFFGQEIQSPVALQAICKELERHPNLTSVDFSGAGIGDEGVKKLIKILKKNPRIKELSLTKNGITDEGANALAEALSSGKANLTELWIDGNAVGDGGIQSLQKAADQQRIFLGYQNYASCEMLPRQARQYFHENASLGSGGTRRILMSLIGGYHAKKGSRSPSPHFKVIRSHSIGIEPFDLQGPGDDKHLNVQLESDRNLLSDTATVMERPRGRGSLAEPVGVLAVGSDEDQIGSGQQISGSMALEASWEEALGEKSDSNSDLVLLNDQSGSSYGETTGMSTSPEVRLRSGSSFFGSKPSPSLFDVVLVSAGPAVLRVDTDISSEEEKGGIVPTPNGVHATAAL
ncbi:MAG: protein NLRC3-like [Gammaproteobacteria bacterium]|jgi:hypothetical protein|nr:protein NLRC3-like [Gammaproteobacteria bacterium]